MNIVVREARNDDAQLIAELTRAAWAGKVSVTSSGHRETAVHVADHLRDGGGFILLVDEKPVGSVRWLPLDAEPDVWEVCRMGVLPEHRGSNLSQHLLEAVIHHGLACGVEEVRLAVRSDQPKLIDFYSAFEFELAEELEYTHANPLEPPPLVMRRMLRY
ncbi:GNAT family N-acetyltransferase [Duganella sp. BJB488]|uniref:GNAT family N-acetyltransferase n=1 Tax=unclassified Duganella TaxID=2636909 RepID=UPI000E355DA7|nr:MULTISPECIES: GNAT family N-acetyltransferase [unclassified Duganella]NVD72605.1 GNAT family N-acetyltransferase [Duganella sp. BJB1802]RFP20219.1 GNAT family N-acetyltransferase [Duganella sp. BJB489]RFP21333.1 GNAT family N-acetyltransferase [Duganella sp. BJB488]RFP33474.1 GNAT family N-acetyltransferase [Duganella sp. BJB480]